VLYLKEKFPYSYNLIHLIFCSRFFKNGKNNIEES